MAVYHSVANNNSHVDSSDPCSCQNRTRPTVYAAASPTLACNLNYYYVCKDCGYYTIHVAEKNLHH
ncbi:hypothetical protein LPJ57_005600, partial [Coemansia sp. RSA 486]